MANSDFPRLRYSDVIETEALGTALVPATFKVAANAPAAEIDPDCHTTSVNIQGCKQLDIFVDVATNPAGPPTATKLYIKVRFSGKLSPATGTNACLGRRRDSDRNCLLHASRREYVMKYFYVPFMQDPDSGAYLPAKTDDGDTVSALGDLIGGINTLKLDSHASGSADRYVLATPDSMVGPEGWTEKTREEVNADYPGLIPVGG